MAEYLPYVWGALGGAGVLAAWYGLQAIRDAEASAAKRRLGLVGVNIGIVMVAASLYFISRSG